MVVIANRSDQEVTFRVGSREDAHRTVTLPRGDLVPVPVTRRPTLQFSFRGVSIESRLRVDSAYFFRSEASGRVKLKKIDLGKTHPNLPSRTTDPASVHEVGILRVKILVDDNEPGKPRIWRERLRRRIEAASQILQKYCRMRLKIVALETWHSDDTIHQFDESFREFEKEVDAFPARLAIGFTSQYRVPRNRMHLGGTRGHLGTHVLCIEGLPRTDEWLRLAILVHELGHVLGAEHSPERGSIMTPVLGTRKARRTPQVIRFDPANSLAMSMIAEEIRARDVRSQRALTPALQFQLVDIYRTMGQALKAQRRGK